MEDKDLERIRVEALEGIRKICNVQTKDGKLSSTLLNTIFSSSDFLQFLFNLFDHDGKGEIEPDQLAKIVRFNLRNYNEDVLSEDLAVYIEGMVSIVVYQSLKITSKDMVRIFANESMFNHVLKRIRTKKSSGMTDEKVEVTVDDFMDFISSLTCSWENQTSLTNDTLNKYIETFRKNAQYSSFFTIDDFGKMLSTKSKFFTNRAFRIFDLNRDGKVTVDEYTETLKRFASNNMDEAIKFIFKVYDSDDDGSLRRDELLEALKASIEESGMMFDNSQLSNMVDAIWEDAKVRDRSFIHFDNFKKQVQSHQKLCEGLAQSVHRWLVPQGRSSSISKKPSWLKEVFNQYKANYALGNFIILMILGNISICCWRLSVFYYSKNYDFSQPNYFFMLARGPGMCLNFNTVMILIFILRHFITVIRRMGLSVILPLDHNITLHTLTGKVIMFFSLAHTLGHLLNFSLNVIPHPVETLNANGLLNLTNYQPPVGCNIMDIENGTMIQKCDDGSPYNFFDWILTAKPNLFGLIPGYANPTGVALLFIVFVMVIGSLPVVRRRGHFEVFYFSHLLYLAYFPLMILHAPSVWKWISAPLFLFVLELVYRLFSSYSGRSVVLSGIVLPSKVTGLVIKKPDFFNHKPGDWVFIKIPAIALFEWHPFTISSAPEQKDTFTLHIRGVGGWTNKLYTFFESEFKRQQEGGERSATKNEMFNRKFRGSVLRLREAAGISYGIMDSKENDHRQGFRVNGAILSSKGLRHRPSTVLLANDEEIGIAPNVGDGGSNIQNTVLGNQLQIFIDGPYGAPASNFFRSEHAVLIGSGIGVTPFSSILQSIMYRYWSNRLTCPRCNHKWTDELPGIFNLKKVDFFWINRDQRSFEWFLQLLTQLEIEQSEKGGMLNHFLETHMYLTSALNVSDMRAVGLQMAMDLLYEKDKRDLITGLKSRTKSGRPNWDSIFTNIRAQNHGTVTVFFCGNPALGKAIRKACAKFGFSFRMEVF